MVITKLEREKDLYSTEEDSVHLEHASAVQSGVNINYTRAREIE